MNVCAIFCIRILDQQKAQKTTDFTTLNLNPFDFKNPKQPFNNTVHRNLLRRTANFYIKLKCMPKDIDIDKKAINLKFFLCVCLFEFSSHNAGAGTFFFKLPKAFSLIILLIISACPSKLYSYSFDLLERNQSNNVKTRFISPVSALM